MTYERGAKVDLLDRRQLRKRSLFFCYFRQIQNQVLTDSLKIWRTSGVIDTGGCFSGISQYADLHIDGDFTQKRHGQFLRAPLGSSAAEDVVALVAVGADESAHVF